MGSRGRLEFKSQASALARGIALGVILPSKAFAAVSTIALRDIDEPFGSGAGDRYLGCRARSGYAHGVTRLLSGRKHSGPPAASALAKADDRQRPGSIAGRCNDAAVSGNTLRDPANASSLSAKRDRRFRSVF